MSEVGRSREVTDVQSAIVNRKEVALHLRQRIERLSTRAWARLTGDEYDTLLHQFVGMRLHLLISSAAPRDAPRALHTVVAVKNVYLETSDVLHGRVRAHRIPDVRLAEWEAIVNAAEGLECSVALGGKGSRTSTA